MIQWGAMRPHPEVDEGPQAAQRFVKALATVLAAPKNAATNPFSKPKPKPKRKKPAARKS